MNPEKQFKGQGSLDCTLFKNSQIYLKSTKIFSLLFNIYMFLLTKIRLIIHYSRLLQGNTRYRQAVKDLRQADYIVNQMTQMKRDLLSQGSVADFSRIESYFSTKWSFWILKWVYLRNIDL